MGEIAQAIAEQRPTQCWQVRPSFKSILTQTNDATELFCFCIRPCWEIGLTNYEFISYDFEAGQILTRDVKIKCNE